MSTDSDATELACRLVCNRCGWTTVLVDSTTAGSVTSEASFRAAHHEGTGNCKVGIEVGFVDGGDSNGPD